MTWAKKCKLTWIQRLLISIIRSGHLPKHIAFIMDGNRRYARQHNARKVDGHSKGFEKLTEALQWCRELGIKEVTVFAFSIENFKRTQEEVKNLMDLAQECLQELIDEKDKLMENGLCVRVIGDLTLLPPAVRKVAAKAMQVTKDNDKSILNVAFAYTARDEITNAVAQVVSGVSQGLLSTADVTQDLLPQIFYSRMSSFPDLVIRTSGEVRLSDFLLWQVSCSCIYFTDQLWPDYSVWNLLGAIFYYQRCYKDMDFVKELENEAKISSATNPSTERVCSFIKLVDEEHQKYLAQSAAVEVTC